MADFDKTLNAGDPTQVVLTQVDAKGTPSVDPLEIVIDGPGDANRMLVFTGIALVDIQFSEDDGIVRRGEVRVRLDFPLSDTVKFISSATATALSSIFNAADEDITFAVDAASTEPQPTDPSNPQSPTELVLTAKLAVQGGKTGISSMAYQANVLVQDSRPDVDHIGVRATGSGAVFQQATGVEIGHQWDIEVVLTAPNTGPSAFPYTVSTSDQVNLPINVLDSIQQVPPPFQQAAKTMIDPVGNVPTIATVIVHGRRNVRTATITIFQTN